MTDDEALNDLLGEPETDDKKPLSRAAELRSKLLGGRTHGLKIINPDAEQMLEDGKMPPTASFRQPVGIMFLSAVFDMKPEQIKKKLKGCVPKAYHEKSGTVHPLYDFVEACSFLVQPKIDIADWLLTQNAATLPNHINKTFWEAMNARQRFMDRARHLWHDKDVIEVLSRTAMMIREETRLWVENLPGKADMTDAQYNALTKNVAELLEQIHDRLVEQPKVYQTGSQQESMQDEIEAAGTSDVKLQ